MSYEGLNILIRFANRFCAQSSISPLSLNTPSTVSCWLYAHLSTLTHAHCWSSCLMCASFECIHDRSHTVASRDSPLQLVVAIPSLQREHDIIPRADPLAVTVIVGFAGWYGRTNTHFVPLTLTSRRHTSSDFSSLILSSKVC